MANKKDLKAFVRYDGTGRVIPGSLILQRKKPKVGNWSQTNAYECCDPACIPPIEITNFVINDVIFGNGGMTVIISTAPGFSMEIDIFNCETGNPVGDPQTVPGGASNFIVFFPEALVEIGCTFTVRTICSNQLVSAWTTLVGS